MRLTSILAIAVLFSLGQAKRKKGFPQYLPRRLNDVGQKLAGVQDGVNYTTHMYKTKLDHFSSSDTRTFDLKYLVNTEYFGEGGGPMFFYTGNEGAIETFAQATGMMWDLAKQFKAVLVFVEHRYYGVSQPFGTYEASYNSTDRLSYLTTSQALADFAAVIADLKNAQSDLTPYRFPPDTKVISFGGSYGGMLSAWFRMKYPHVVIGAWASSAPVLYFNGGGVDWGGFDQITTATYAKSGCNTDAIGRSWDAVKRLAANSDGRTVLNAAFEVADSSLLKGTAGEADALNDYIREAVEYMAMTDYPYTSEFLTPMPGWPAQVGCQYIPKNGTFDTDEKLARAMASLISVYYNWNNDTDYRACFDESCGDAGTEALGTPLGWPWQECSEVIIEMCSRGGSNDFFWNECAVPPIDAMKQICKGTFGSIGWKDNMLDEFAVPVEYGMTFDGVTNLILTQGELDPWRAGGVSESDNKRGLFVVPIQNSAHHLDLRQPNTCDPSNLASVRYQAVRIMQCWLDASKCPSSYSIADPAQSTIPAAGTECKDIVEGFPWGQKDSSSSALFTFFSMLIVLLNL